MSRFLKLCTLLLIIIQCGNFHNVSAQVFPGDANNDGVVNNLDILYIGYAYGAVGPARAEDSVDPSPQAVALLWQENFPDSLNYAYSDANGDGFIGGEDLLTIFTNYGKGVENVRPAEFPRGMIGVDPRLSFQIPDLSFPLTAGSVLRIPINLGSRAIPVENFNGIAFTVEFDSAAIQDISLEFDDSWISPDNSSFTFQHTPELATNNLDVAVTRLSPNPIRNGQGKIGTLSIIVEDDLIELMEGRIDSSNTILKFKQIFMVDEHFKTVPVVTDSLLLKIYHPLLVGTEEPKWSKLITYFPNPVSSSITIHAPTPVHRIDFFNSMATHLSTYTFEGGKREINLNCENFYPGAYFMQMSTEKGRAVKRFFVK